MSFQIGLSDRSKIAARFIRRVHREIQNAFSRQAKQGMTQQDLAKKLEVNRATVNKRLLGQDNLTLRSIADMAWAMDCDLDFKMVPKVQRANANTYKAPAPNHGAPLRAVSVAQSSTISGSSKFVIKQMENNAR